jgi:Na+/melibiose symporter-like transporter
MGKKENAVVDGNKKPFLHTLFGSTPGDGEMQPKEGLSYSLCGFGQNLICTVIGSYLTVFMTDAIGFPALAVALLMLGARIFDALNDPIMGSIVDRTRTKWGKCRPYMKWMAFPIAAMTVVCFLPFYPNTDGGFAALSILYIVWGVIYTVADVPYWGLSTAMSNDTYRRGNLLTIARLFCTAGAGIVTVFTPIITQAITSADNSVVSAIQSLMNAINGGEEVVASNSAFFAMFSGIENVGAYIQNLLSADKLASITKTFGNLGLNINQSGAALLQIKQSASASMMQDLRFTYFIIAIVCCVIALPLFFLGYKNTTERNQSFEKPPSLKHNLKLLFKNKPLMLIVLSGIGGAARMLFTYTGGLYFAKYIMNKESMYSLFTMAIVPGGLIASLLVPFFTKKFGKRNTYIWSHVIGGVAMLIAFIVGIAFDHGNYSSMVTTVVLIIALVISGIPQGFGNILTYAMIGDTVEYLELKTGERAEGICFAMQTLINKIAMAVGAFVGVLAYYMAGVEVGNASAVTAQGKDTMWIMLVLIAAISFFLTIIPLFFYKFNEKQQQEAKEEINRRKAALAGGDNAALATDSAGSIDKAAHGFAPLEIFPNEDGVAIPIEERENCAERSEASAQTEIPEDKE